MTDVYSTKTFSPFTHAAAAGPDRTIWFTEANIGIHSTTVNKLNVDGSEVDVKLPGGGDSNGVALGPDGSMWITQAIDFSGTYSEFSTGRLVRIFRSGEIKVYDIPTRDGSPVGVAVDPHGNVWFTESKAAKIGYRSTSGAFKEYTLADKASSPTALAIGSDGDIWFVESGSGRIGLMDRRHRVHVFSPFEGDRNGSLSIATDGSGDLWVADDGASAIVKMNHRGVVQRVDAVAEAITRGPDGSIWFLTANSVGRIASDSHVTTYPIPVDGIDMITSGPDGNLWLGVRPIAEGFGEWEDIGKFTLSRR